jgi:hypothetical protein
MPNHIKYSLLLVLVILIGCKDDDTSLTANASLKGNIVGYVITYDSTGSNTDKSGVKISIDGTKYSAISDTSGRWEMKDVPPGTYNISFTKDSYAMQKNIVYRFVGNGTDYLGYSVLFQIAKRNASLVLKSFQNYDQVRFDSIGRPIDTTVLPFYAANFTCRLFRNDSAESLKGNTLILFGKTENISPLDPSSYLFSIDNPYYIDNNTALDANGYSFYIYREKLLNSGFKSGDKIYCQAFVSNIKEWGWGYTPSSSEVLTPSYFDIATAKQIYTCFGDNHSEVKSFILP